MATVHGGLDAAELRRLGLRPEQVLDFSSNVNPLGPSLRVRNAAAKANLSAYPGIAIAWLSARQSQRVWRSASIRFSLVTVPCSLYIF